ncbi:MAG: ATP-binding protein [Thermomicrobiales bacterium]|nr:ATP-binding protein [Thermomicrobiales bacterium]
MESLDRIDARDQSPNGHVAEPPAPQRKFVSFIDDRTGPIGRVVGSEKEPAGAHVFAFWAADSATTLDVGHLVVAFSEEAAVIGVVDEPRRFSDMKSFLDDYFDRRMEEGLADELITRRPEMLVFSVRVLATKHLRDDVGSHRPAISGPVWFATPAAIDFALGKEDFSGIPIPALMHTNGNPAWGDDGNPLRNEAGDIVFQRSPIWIDSDYLLGPEAGHANWTGQSGLATKTSHAVFLLTAVFQKMRQNQRSVAALMFNVKGPDLLWLDKPANPEPEYAVAYQEARSRPLRGEDLAAYDALDLEPAPFGVTGPFRIFAPFKPNQAPGDRGETDVQLDRRAASLAGKLNTDRDDPAQVSGVVYPILWELKPLLRMPHKLFDFGDLDDKLSSFIYELRGSGVESLNQFDERMAEIEAYFAEDPSKTEWHGHHKFTIQKAKNRFGGLHDKFGGLLSRALVNYGDLPQVDGPFRDQELRVVDIADCNTDVQELLVTKVIEQVWRMAEQQKLGVETVVIFVDELNKYAPAGGQGGLRDTLVDIAARGRHLNVVLFGAEQFRSKVDGEILGNCGTSFYGRVGDEELVNAAYRSLSDTTRQELLGLKKGRLLARHAHFRAPLFGAFPLKPTIDGMMGQRIFNGERTAPVGHPADGLWKTLSGLMGEQAPAKHEVRTVADGLDPEDILKAVQQINTAYSNGVSRGANPWRSAQQILNRARAR